MAPLALSVARVGVDVISISPGRRHHRGCGGSVLHSIRLAGELPLRHVLRCRGCASAVPRPPAASTCVNRVCSDVCTRPVQVAPPVSETPTYPSAFPLLIEVAAVALCRPPPPTPW
jgi:hypothetical protein